jgi:cell wall assembly regulator SMI1
MPIREYSRARLSRNRPHGRYGSNQEPTMIQIRTTNRPLEPSDLARIEDKMGRPLPEAYRAFLLVHNGGQPHPNGIDIPGWGLHSTDVKLFFGLDDEFECNDLLWHPDWLEGCLENHLLPIADDSGGNNFVLVLADEDYGQVYYFDAREIPPRPYFVAKDFPEFLSKLRETKLD